VPAAAGHGLGGRGQRDATTTRGRKTPPRVAGCGPVWPQPCPGAVWQGDIPLVPACAVPDVAQQGRAVASAPLPRGALRQAQPTGSERGKADAGAAQSDTAAPLAHRCEAQAHRPFGRARGADTGAGGPVSVAGVREDARAAAPRKRARAPCVLLAMRAGEEIRPACGCGEHGWGRVSVLRQWAHGPDVHRLRTGSQAPELEILEPSAAEFWQGSTSEDWGEGFAPDVEGDRTRDRRRRLHSGVGGAQLRAALSSTMPCS